jgi:23S rRNA (guanosine2251-2'-O)-methyltransferase
MIETDSHLIYGIHPVREAITQRSRPVEKVFFDKSLQGQQIFLLLKECKKSKIPYQVVAAQKLEALVGRVVHQGVVAICGVKTYCTIQFILDKAQTRNEPPFLVLADGVEDPRNLGALIRTCVGAGIHGLLLPRTGNTPITPNVAKAAVGTLENIAIAKPPNIEQELKDLHQKGFEIIGLETNTQNHYRSVDYSRPLITVIGGENTGISPYIRRCCTKFCSIPLHPDCQSLNLSVAAGIFLFEVVHQRNKNSCAPSRSNIEQ